MKRLPSFHLCQILARGTAADAVSKLWLHGIESRSCSAVGLGSYREASSSTQAPRSPPTPAGPTSSSVLEHRQLSPPGAASTALGGPQAGSRKLTWLPLYNDEEEEGGERASAPAVPEDDFVFQHAATAGPFVAYKAGRLKGLYRKDVHQEQLVEMLQQLFEKLQGRQPPKHSGLTMLDSIDSHELEPATPWWQRLTGSNSGGGGSGSGSGSTEQGPAPGEGAVEAAHRGIYMFGGVGCGKTMVMDLFADSAIPEMRLLRTHFHEFMLDIHARLKRYANNQDPLVRVADRIATKTRVLCLDEFFVTDVADAMILHRLFGQLWDRGVVLVATSNRHPDQLYEGGLQRQLFLPFIARLKQVCTVHQVGSGVDYRRLAQHQVGMYFTSDLKDAELKERFEELSEGAEQQAVEVSVMMGRTFKVSCAAGKAAQLTFRELCDQPVSAADFIALVEQFHTIAVEGIPIFTGANRSAAYRFVTLIDVLYEHRVRMLCSAEASPFDLFQNIVTQEQARELRGTSLAEARRLKRGDQPSADDDMVVDDNLGFAKDRTVSRLVEMQSLEYGLAHAEQYDPQLLLAMREMQQQQERAKQA